MVDKATELRAKWMSLEGEKYDIEMTFKKQDYDVCLVVTPHLLRPLTRISLLLMDTTCISITKNKII